MAATIYGRPYCVRAPRPPASGARARAGLLSCLAVSRVHVLAADAEALAVAAGEDGEEDGGEEGA